MLRVAVCDDVRAVCDTLHDWIIGVSGVDGLPDFYVETFTSGESLYQAVQNGRNFDLYILDIDLKTTTGILVALGLRKELGLKKSQILYISGRQEFGLEIFGTRPLDFLLKPLDYSAVIQCLRTTAELIGLNAVYFEYKLKKQMLRIAYQDIYFFESCNKLVIVHMLKGSTEVRKTLAEIEAGAPKNFIRISQSFFVNYNYVTQFGYGQIVLENGTALTIGPTYRKAVQNWIFTDSREV